MPATPVVTVLRQENVNVEILDPNNNVIESGASGYSILSNLKRRYQEVDAPTAGEWTIRVTGNGEYSLRIVGESDIHLAYEGPTTGAVGDTIRVQAQLYADGDVALSDIKSASFTLVSMNGERTIPIELFDDGSHGDGAAGDGLYGGTVQVDQAGCMYLTVNGTLANGDGFQRQVAAPIRFRGFQIANPIANNVLADSDKMVSFVISNQTGDRSTSQTTFDIEAFSEQGWADFTNVPETLTLAAGESRTIEIPLQVPSDAATGTTEEVSLVVAPQGDIGLSSVAVAETTVVDELSIFIPAVFR